MDDKSIKLQYLESKNKQAAIDQLEHHKDILEKYLLEFGTFESALEHVTKLIHKIEKE
jgi:hypothetical protein